MTPDSSLMPTYTIYALVDPSDGLIRYVGMAQDLYSRFIQHINCESRNAEKNLWIMSCRSKGLMIQMRTLDFAGTREEALDVERKWIEHYVSLKMPLLNKTIVKEAKRKQEEMEEENKRLEQQYRQLEIEGNRLRDEVAKQQSYVDRLNQAKEQLEGVPVVRKAKTGRYQEKRDEMFPLALVAWKSGYQTRRSLATHLGITFYQADLLCKDIEEALK